jgi:tetratricopeptide (TPR) repeat protein
MAEINLAGVPPAQLDAAIRERRRALAHARTPAERARLAGGLGALFLQRGDLHEAARYLHQALRLQPGAAVISYNLGEVAAARLRIDEAMGWYGRAVEDIRKGSCDVTR